MRRILALLLAAPLLLFSGAGSVAKQQVTIELFYSGVWNNHTADMYTRHPVSIAHAAGNEQSGLVPSEASLTFQGRDGRMNPANIRSPLFGLIGRNTPIRISVSDDFRFSGQVVSWKPRRAVKGDTWVHVVAGGHLRQLGQGNPPVESALRRWIRLNEPTVYWPLDSGQLSTAATPAAGDADPFAADSGIAQFGGAPLAVWLEPGVTIAEDVIMRAHVRGMDTTPDSITVDHVRRADNGGSVSSFLDLFGNRPAGGTLFAITVAPASQEIFVQATEDAGGGADTELFGVSYPPLFTSEPHHMRFKATQNGADIDVRLEIDGELALADTFDSALLSGVRRVDLSYAAASAQESLTLGHLAIWENTVFDIGDGPDAAFGYPGELAGTRFERLCTELGITATIVGTAAQTQPMGPQHPDTDLNLLREIAATDNGRIFDTRSQLGLTFRTGRSLYNQ